MMSKDLNQAFIKNFQDFNPAAKENELLKRLWQCTEMIEKYHFQVFKKQPKEVIYLQAVDKKQWMETFFPQLVESDIILDYQFYDPSGKQRHLGIGNDSCFVRDEYINVRYQLYRKLYSYYQPFLKAVLQDPLQRVVMECLEMLEPYLKSFQNNIQTRSALMTFQSDDKKRWLNCYFPVLVESTLFADYTITDSLELRKSFGIGDDAITNGPDLQHFACECYRYLLIPVHANERLMCLKR